MRLLVLLLSLPLFACDQSDQGKESGQGSGMTAEAISSNDVTAIDAVTGEAANIAADVDLDANLLAEGNQPANAGVAAERPRRGSSTSGANRPSRAPATAAQPDPAPAPDSNEAQ